MTMEIDDGLDGPALGHNNPPTDIEIMRLALDEKARPLLARRDAEITPHLDVWLDRKIIVSEEEAKIAADFGKTAGAFLSEFETFQAAESKPHHERWKGTIDHCKTYYSKIEQAREHVRRLGANYLTAENNRRAQEARDAAAAAQKAREEEAQKNPPPPGAEPAAAPEPPPMVEVESATVKSTSGVSLSGRKSWDFRVIDITKVDPKYLQINEAMVKAYCKGRKEKPVIEGLEFMEKISARFG